MNLLVMQLSIEYLKWLVTSAISFLYSCIHRNMNSVAGNTEISKRSNKAKRQWEVMNTENLKLYIRKVSLSNDTANAYNSTSDESAYELNGNSPTTNQDERKSRERISSSSSTEHDLTLIQSVQSLSTVILDSFQSYEQKILDLKKKHEEVVFGMRQDFHDEVLRAVDKAKSKTWCAHCKNEVVFKQSIRPPVCSLNCLDEIIKKKLNLTSITTTKSQPKPKRVNGIEDIPDNANDEPSYNKTMEMHSEIPMFFTRPASRQHVPMAPPGGGQAQNALV